MFSGGNWGEDRGGVEGASGGKRGKDVNRERGGKILARKREKISGREGLRRKRGKGSQQGTGGERS